MERRYRLSDPNASLDFICTMMRFASSVSQISACPFSEKMPFVLMMGWITMQANVPAGTLMRFAAQDADRHRVAVGDEVPVELVRLARRPAARCG